MKFATCIIVIADQNGWRQPFVERLVKALEVDREVKILGFRSDAAKGFESLVSKAVWAEDFSTKNPAEIARRWLRKARLTSIQKSFPGAYFNWPTTGLNGLLQIGLALKKFPEAQIIAIDSGALCAAHLGNRSAVLVQLEVLDRDILELWVPDWRIESIISNNELRIRSRYPKINVPLFVVPNAPDEFNWDHRRSRRGMVFAGSFIPQFGAYEALEYLKENPGENLTICGALPDHLLTEYGISFSNMISNGRIIHCPEGVEENQYLERNSNFEISFVFYMHRPSHVPPFAVPYPGYPFGFLNYETGYAGKAGMSAAAGVPMIANETLGLRFIKEFGAGILLEDVTPDTIGKAVSVIRNDYSAFQEGCKQLAKHHSFSKCVGPFLDWLAKR